MTDVMVNGKGNTGAAPQAQGNAAATTPAAVIERLCAGAGEGSTQKAVCEAAADLLRAAARLVELAAGAGPKD